MKRFAAFDPPEYLEWTLSPELLDEYSARIARDAEVRAEVESLSRDELLSLYRDLLLTRLHDISLKRWVRTGVISKAWLGTGEEAVTVGSVAALDRERDFVSPMIRNAGACHMMGMDLGEMFKGYLATSDAPNGGRDLHIGAPRLGVIQPISHMGTNVPVMAGIALSFKLRGEDRVALTWIGDGATKTGECHEGMNFAAVQRLPIIFIIQNNQVALGTRLEQHGAGDLARWPQMYGIPSRESDGNNVLEMLGATRLAARTCRRGDGPVAIVANTFRMGGHATHDEREARDTFPAELFDEWGKRDPVGLFENYLMGTGATPAELEAIEVEATAAVDRGAESALASKGLLPEPHTALYEGFSVGGVLAGLDSRPIQIPT